MSQRNKSNDLVRGMSKTLDMTYNEQAGALKVLGPIVGQLTPMGAADTIHRIQRGALIAFFNSDAAVQFVSFGDAAVVAPTDFTDGLPLPPGQYTILAAGNAEAFISNSGDVYAYLVQDDSFLR